MTFTKLNEFVKENLPIILSCDFFCKAWLRFSVISITSFIMHKKNTNLKSTRWLKAISAYAWTESTDASTSMLWSTKLNVLNIFMRLEIELKWVLHLVPPGHFNVQIWLVPWPVSSSSMAIMHASSITWEL
jgi:hypothetical protein